MSPLDQAVTGTAMLAVGPLLGLAVDVAMQVILARIPLAIGHLRRQFISFGVGFVIVMATLWLLMRQSPLSAVDCAGYGLLHVAVYVFGAFCFFNVINLNISSLRIRMLKAYLQEHPRPLPDEALMATCSAAGMLTARLERLLDGQQIRMADDRIYFRYGVVRVVGLFFQGLRRFLIGH